jgi:hypothetical protein
MAPHYKERIVSFQDYLSQVRLYRSEEIVNRQTDDSNTGYGVILYCGHPAIFMLAQ